MLKNNEYKNFSLNDGDSLHVPEAPKILNYVMIEGQIKNSGRYPYEKGMTLKNLIDATMTLNDSNFVRTIDFNNILISRVNVTKSETELIRANIDADDFKLKNMDHITLPRKKEEFVLTVKITGQIKYPGAYVVNNRTTLNDVVELAGGLTNHALRDGIEIFRDSVSIAWEDDRFYLNDNDSLHVLQKTGLVLLKGEVNIPGYVSFKKGLTINDYIKKAGGLNSFADSRDIFIVYPNGISRPYSKWRTPKVKEGSTIVINRRMISGSSQGPTGWETFSSVASQAGNIATTLLSLALIINQTNAN